MKIKQLLPFVLALLISQGLAESVKLPLNSGKEKLPTGLNVVTSVKGETIHIELNDGKLKYGVHNIVFKKGDVTITRPRLTLQTPVEKVQKATSDKPYHVVDFSHDGTAYTIEIISGGSEAEVVITKK